MTTHARSSFSRLDVYRELADGTRVSQRNGCALRLDMHQRDAHSQGERPQGLDGSPPGAKRTATTPALRESDAA